MLRSQDLQSHDSPVSLFIFVSSQPIKLRSFTHLIEPLPNKQYRLIASLQKDYLQINAFLASSGKVEINLETLQMKATVSQWWWSERKVSIHYKP